MKNSYLIVVIVVVIFLLTAGVYYFCFHKYSESTAYANKVVGQFGEGSRLEKYPEYQGDMTSELLVEKKETSNEEPVVIRYLYRSNFRNPFQSYRTALESSSSSPLLEDIREIVSFELKGIVVGQDKKIAIIDTGGRTRLITTNDTVDEFRVLKIRERDLLMSYQGWRFTIEMGSETDEYI